MTVAELKKILESYPDDAEVIFISARGIEEDGTFSEVKHHINELDKYYTEPPQLVLR